MVQDAGTTVCDGGVCKKQQCCTKGKIVFLEARPWTLGFSYARALFQNAAQATTFSCSLGNVGQVAGTNHLPTFQATSLSLQPTQGTQNRPVGFNRTTLFRTGKSRRRLRTF